MSMILVGGHQRRHHSLGSNAGQQGVARGIGTGEVRGSAEVLIEHHRDAVLARYGLLLDRPDDYGAQGAALSLRRSVTCCWAEGAWPAMSK